MRANYLYILALGIFIDSCGHRQQLVEEKVSSESYVEAVSKSKEPTESTEENLVVEEPSVIFFVSRAGEINTMPVDNATREGLIQAVGDFAYYAGIVADSLQAEAISIHFTDKRHIVLGSQTTETYDRYQSNSPMGMILYDGIESYKVLPGMQTHISMLAAVSDFFHDRSAPEVPLLDYFSEAEFEQLHIYSSHSDILNQAGNKINPAYYQKFGQKLANRAGKYHMGLYAYQKFPLSDSLVAVICRVPSTYDESSVKLYIWNENTASIIGEKQLAENVWNEHWILVEDSWITRDQAQGNISIITRKKEARMENGERQETDSLYQWHWTGSGFEPRPAHKLAIGDFPLKDWESYQEPKAPTEITIIDEEHVWLPLETGDLTWENIIMELPKPYSIEKEPIHNQFTVNQIDTLITISRPNLRLKFYQAPDNILLIDGTMTDGSIQLKRGVKVGISKVDFIGNFQKLSTQQNVPNLVKVRSKSADRIITYSFQGDTLARIEITNFIH